MIDYGYEFHNVAGYILFPVRVLSLLVTVLSCASLVVFSDKVLSNDTLTKRILDRTLEFIMYIVGLNINIVEDDNYKEFVKNNEYSDRNYIIVFNHIHLYDSFMMYNMFCSKKLVSGVIVEHMANKFPINIIVRLSESIIIDRDKRMGTVSKIKERLFRRRNVIIAPDSCQDPGEELIAPFKTGAFAPDQLILPVVIRYVPSTDRNLVWNRDSDLQHITNALLDGHIDGYIKLLDFEPPKHDGDVIKFRDYVHATMVNGIKSLPYSTPPRVDIPNEEIKHADIRMKCLSLAILPVTLFAMFLHNNILLFANLVLYITGYFSYYNPTNNTNMLNNIVFLSTTAFYYMSYINNLYEFYFLRTPLYLWTLWNFHGRYLDNARSLSYLAIGYISTSYITLTIINSIISYFS